jgi:hypothetical protein
MQMHMHVSVHSTVAKLLLPPFQIINYFKNLRESNILSLIKIIEKIIKNYNIKYIYYENIINEEYNNT